MGGETRVYTRSVTHKKEIQRYIQWVRAQLYSSGLNYDKLNRAEYGKNHLTN